MYGWVIKRSTQQFAAWSSGHFSQMCSAAKGPRFTLLASLGVWGLGIVRLFANIRNRPQPSATIRDEDAVAVPLASAAKEGSLLEVTNDA